MLLGFSTAFSPDNKKCTGKTACCFSARKRLLGRVSRPIFWASVYNQSAVTEHSLCSRPSLTELEHGRLTGSAPQGAGVTGTVESGRPPTGGPVRSDRKEPRSSRVSRPFGTRSITGRTI